MGIFQFKRVTVEDELIEVFKLRYKIYCEEWGFEKPEDYPGGLETDEFDKYSLHFAAVLKDTNQLIGTVRIILNSEKGFPLERHCKIDVNLTGFNRDKIGEISRLAISKEYHRRLEDRFIYKDIAGYDPEICRFTNNRRKRQEIVIGLYKCIYVESKKMGLTHWYAVMTKGLKLLLKRMGIFFVPIGPDIYYHGIRTPYLGSIEAIENEVLRVNPELYKEFLEGLRLQS